MAVRVLQIFGAMDRGGAEMRSLELMRRVDRARIHLEFCTLSGREGSLAPEIRRLGGDVHPCKLGARFPIEFVKLVRRGNYDAVHSHVHLTSGMVLALAAVAGARRRIAHFRTTEDERGNTVQRRAYRALMHQAIDRIATDIVGCGSGALAFGWSPDWRSDPRCQVILNGVDTAPFALADQTLEVRRELGIPATAPIAIHVGRFDRVKNQSRVVDVFRAANAPDAHLVFAGRGGTPEEEQVRAQVAAHGLGDRVHFVGERTDVPRLLCAADAAIMTSLHEGMPGAVLEALAAGLPVIANDLPGVREIGEHLAEIEILRLEDRDATWGEALARRLARRPTELSRRAARQRFDASPFSLAVSLAAHVALWTR